MKHLLKHGGWILEIPDDMEEGDIKVKKGPYLNDSKFHMQSTFSVGDFSLQNWHT